MPATAADAAKYTNDGVVLSSNAAAGNAIAALHPDAKDTGTGEIPMFFTKANVAQAMVDEKFGFLSKVNPPHVGVEVEDALGLGSTIPVTPTVPCFTAVDDKRALNKTLRTRAYTEDTDTQRYSVELLD